MKNSCVKKRKARCPRMNSLAVLGPAVYTKIYCRVSSVVHPSWENRVTLTMKRIEAGRQFPMIVALAACRQPGGCRRIPYIGSERKNSVRKTGERYKHREEKSEVRQRRAEARGNSAPLPHMAQPHTRAQTRVPGQWVGYSCAVPGCHNSVGQMSPGRTQLLLLLSMGLYCL